MIHLHSWFYLMILIPFSKPSFNWLMNLRKLILAWLKFIKSKILSFITLSSKIQYFHFYINLQMGSIIELMWILKMLRVLWLLQ